MKKLFYMMMILMTLSSTAMARLAPGLYEIQRDDEIVGEVYVAPANSTTRSFVEHWVYYPDPDWLTYPNPEWMSYPDPDWRRADTVFVPVSSPYRSAMEFLSDISREFRNKARYFKSTSVEIAPLPSP